MIFNLNLLSKVSIKLTNNIVASHLDPLAHERPTRVLMSGGRTRASFRQTLEGGGGWGWFS